MALASLGIGEEQGKHHTAAKRTWVCQLLHRTVGGAALHWEGGRAIGTRTGLHDCVKAACNPNAVDDKQAMGPGKVALGEDRPRELSPPYFSNAVENDVIDGGLLAEQAAPVRKAGDHSRSTSGPGETAIYVNAQNGTRGSIRGHHWLCKKGSGGPAVTSSPTRVSLAGITQPSVMPGR